MSRSNIFYVFRLSFIIWIFFLILIILKLNILQGKSINMQTILNHDTMIFDRNGEPLSLNVKVLDLYIDVQKYHLLSNREKSLVFSTYNLFHNNFNNFSDFNNYMKKVISKYLLLKKKMEEPNLIISIEKNFSKKNNNIFPFLFSYRKERHANYGNIFCHIIGLNNNNILSLNSVNKFLYTSTHNIDNIFLTIDTNIHSLIHSVMKESISKYEANGGWSIMIELKTGNILAAVSIDDFDPNNINTYIDFNNTNRLIHYKYEFGSIIKIISTAFFLKEGIRVSDRFQLGSYYTVDKFKIKDVTNNTGIHDFKSIFRKSSNVGFATIASKLSIENYVNFLKNIGYETSGQVSEIWSFNGLNLNMRWNNAKFISSLYGYSIFLTPIHLTYIMRNIFLGYKSDLNLIKRIKYTNHEKNLNNLQVTKKKNNEDKILSEKNIDDLLFLAHNIVVESVLSQNNNFIKKFNGCLKTGTAKIIQNHTYDNKKINAFVVYLWPKHKPKYMILIGIENPTITKAHYLSSHFTVPTLNKILQQIQDYCK